jgi:excisionase family DNA binding protein
LPEVAAILGISRIAVFKKVKKGQLQALRFGRNWAVPAAALAAAEAPPPAAPVPAPLTRAPRTVKSPEPAPPAVPDADLDSMGWD